LNVIENKQRFEPTVADWSRVYYRGTTPVEADAFLKRHKDAATAMVFRDGQIVYASYWPDFAPQYRGLMEKDE
jgi:hypothetical protein